MQVKQHVITKWHFPLCNKMKDLRMIEQYGMIECFEIALGLHTGDLW